VVQLREVVRHLLGIAWRLCSVYHSSKAVSIWAESCCHRARRSSAEFPSTEVSILLSCRLRAYAACASAGTEVRDSKNFLPTCAQHATSFTPEPGRRLRARDGFGRSRERLCLSGSARPRGRALPRTTCRSVRVSRSSTKRAWFTSTRLNHASLETTMFYDRSRDQITLDTVERIII
jgi:hypothetical protein